MRLLLLLLVSGLATANAEDAAVCLDLDGTNERLCSESKWEYGSTINSILSSLVNEIKRSSSHYPIVETNEIRVDVPAEEGIFSTNSKIDEGATLMFSPSHGFESLASDGHILYGCAEDGVYKLDTKTGSMDLLAHFCDSKPDCSRPLGIRKGNGDDLFIADGYLGLIRLNAKTGKFEILMDMATPVDGILMKLPDDLDIDLEKNMIYMSDGSTKWALDDYGMSMLEGENTGRIVTFDLNTNKSGVLAKDFYFANGVQLSIDHKHLLVSDFHQKNVLKVPLTDSLRTEPYSRNELEPFTVHFPGHPDNIRPTLDGKGYWIALCLANSNGKLNFLDHLYRNPKASKALIQLSRIAGGALENIGSMLGDEDFKTVGEKLRSGSFISNAYPKHGILVEVDLDGNVLQTLQSDKHAALTEVRELKDGLYVGSFFNPHIIKIPRSNYRST